MENVSTAIRQLLTATLSSERIESGINKFKEGNVAFREAADMSGLDYWDFQSELDKRDIPVMNSITLAERRIMSMKGECSEGNKLHLGRIPTNYSSGKGFNDEATP